MPVGVHAMRVTGDDRIARDRGPAAEATGSRVSDELADAPGEACPGAADTAPDAGAAPTAAPRAVSDEARADRRRRPAPRTQPLRAEERTPSAERSEAPARRRNPAAGSQPVRRGSIRVIRRTVLPEAVRVTIELDREVAIHEERIARPGSRVRRPARGAMPRAALRIAAEFVGRRRRPGGSRRARHRRHHARGARPREPGDAQRLHALQPVPRRHRLDRMASPAQCSRRTRARAPIRCCRHARRAVRGEAPALAPSRHRSRKSSSRSRKRQACAAVDSVAPVRRRRAGRSPTTTSPAAPPSPASIERDARAIAAPLQAKKTVTSQQIAKEPAAIVPAPPAANLQGRFSLSRQLGLGISRIVIDPGHGGHDPGAQVQGLNEADLVLDVALRLQQLLPKAARRRGRADARHRRLHPARGAHRHRQPRRRRSVPLDSRQREPERARRAASRPTSSTSRRTPTPRPWPPARTRRQGRRCTTCRTS